VCCGAYVGLCTARAPTNPATDGVQARVFFARFYAGDTPFPDGRIPEGSDEERLNFLLESLPDVPVIMQTMAPALRKIVPASFP
jgi:hypothetical protein